MMTSKAGGGDMDSLNQVRLYSFMSSSPEYNNDRDDASHEYVWNLVPEVFDVIGGSKEKIAQVGR